MGNATIAVGDIPGGTLVSRKRWFYAGLGLVMLLFLGLIYAWSIFVTDLEAEFHWSRSETSMAFSICMAMFCVGGLAAGLASKKFSFKRIVAVASLFIGMGFLLASRLESLAGLYSSYSLLVGFGVGACYNAVLSNMLRWFPDKTGTVSGLMLMGFGGGALVLGPLCHSLLTSIGWRETFFLFSIIYTAFFFGASFLMNTPPSDTVFPTPDDGKRIRESGGEVETFQMLRRRSFYIYVAWAAIMNGIGAAMIGQAAPLAQELKVEAAAAAILTGVVSMANGLGRVLGGLCFDFFGRNVLMRGASLGVVLCSGVLYLCLQNNSVVLIAVAFVLSGLCYGMGTIAHSAVTASFYGMRNYPLNFSLVTMNTLVSSFIGPYLAGVMHTGLHSYAGFPWQMLIFGVLALSLAVCLKRP